MTTLTDLSLDDRKTLDAAAWHQLPRDAGQMVDVRWCAVGGPGAIRRVVDRSQPADSGTTYTLHAWKIRGPLFQPWNGHVGVLSRGRKLTPPEAATIIRRAQ